MTASTETTLADLVVLGLLCEQPMHGYQLVAELERRDVEDWATISRPHVYYSLKKLARLGLVERADDAARPAGPARLVYRVTASGRRALAEALAAQQWARQRPPPPFLTWLALSIHARPADRLALIEARQHYLTAQLARERATLQAIEADTGPSTGVAAAMVSLCIRQFEVELAWLGDTVPGLFGDHPPPNHKD
jgi:DNA-binding PadR family transcriptional regulator